MKLLPFLIAGLLSACNSTGGLRLPFAPAGSKSIPVPQLTTPDSDIAATLWPLSFAGALAILAGIVSMVLMPGMMGKRTLLIGVAISLVPPMFLALDDTLLVPAATVALVIGAGMFISTLRTIKKEKPCTRSSP
jgi:hypothetical protein